MLKYIARQPIEQEGSQVHATYKNGYDQWASIDVVVDPGHQSGNDGAGEETAKADANEEVELRVQAD